MREARGDFARPMATARGAPWHARSPGVLRGGPPPRAMLAGHRPRQPTRPIAPCPSIRSPRRNLPTLVPAPAANPRPP